ncbi:hypothetical protein FRC11_012974, partial [Ceratobasidium sp. 423]
DEQETAQPGLSRIHNATGLQTPPATQPSATNFPVDPSILEFTNLSQDEPLLPGVPQILVEPSPELNPASVVGVDEMPPPPPLPIESEPQLNDPSTENEITSTTPAKSKRGRQRSVKEPKPRKHRKTAKSQDAHTEGRPGKAMTVEEKIEALKHEAARAAETEDAEPLDPTTATMASLCESDIATGRLNSKYLEKGIAELGASLSPLPEREPGPPEETFAESAAAPEIRFVNGEMVLDEDSQFYDIAGPRFRMKIRWTPLQCKNKTKSEDRRGNEKRITLAIKTRIPLADLEEFGPITGQDLSGPPPEIRAPVAPPRAESEEQAPLTSSVKAKATSSTPSTTPRKNRKLNSHAEEEIMTLEQYERTERVTNPAH